MFNKIIRYRVWRIINEKIYTILNLDNEKNISYDIYKDSENIYYKITYNKYGEQLPTVEVIENKG